MTDAPAAYCPDCGHLIGNDDVVRIIGRHPDGVEPSFRCPACDAEVTHPSDAPDGAPTYEGRDPPRTSRSEGAFGGADRTVVAAGAPPVDLGDARAGDRASLHYRVPGMAALQTVAGTVADAGTPLVVEADTGRAYRVDPADGTLSGADAGRVVRLEVHR